jgi:hypothetical protein
MAAMGTITMESATAVSPQVVKAEYAVQGTLTTPVTLDVYRSATTTFNAMTSTLVGQLALQASDLTPATHDVTVAQTQTLGINPSEKYVLAVAHIGDTTQPASPTDSFATFRIWIVGAVTHGYQPTGQFPSWVQSTADAMKTAGYDSTVAFDWAAASALPISGVVPQAAQAMTALVNQAITSLPVGPNDVVDVHLIGHSRGGDVVSLVAGILQTERSQPPLAGGYIKLTLLDPHPSRNGPVAYYSSSNGPIGVLAQAEFLAFQAATNDPPLTIPVGVNSIEIFYQHTTVPNAILPDEHFLMSWGEVPAGGSTTGVVYYDLTGTVNSHEGIHDFYLQQIVPLLATGTSVPLPPSPVPSAPTTGGPAFPNRNFGTQYEAQLLRKSGVTNSVSSHLLRSYATLDAWLAQRKFPAANSQITKIERFVASQSGKGIPASAASYLQGQLELARVLLIPHSRTSAHAGRSAAASTSRRSQH